VAFKRKPDLTGRSHEFETTSVFRSFACYRDPMHRCGKQIPWVVISNTLSMNGDELGRYIAGETMHQWVIGSED